MRAVAVVLLFVPSIAFAQPAQKLPGGAVMKPGHPPPVVPLAAPMQMKELEPLAGKWTATNATGQEATIDCAATADAAWLRCDVKPAAGGAAAVLVGWDRAARGYRAYVADSTSASHVYKGTAKNGTIALRGDNATRVQIAVGKTPIVVTIGTQAWTLAPAR